MALVTLKQLRDRVRQRADMVYSQFVTDAELNNYLNDSLRELYDILVRANIDYYSNTYEFTVTGSNYTLPVNEIYKLRGLDQSYGGSWVPVWQYSHMERGRWTEQTVSRLVANVRYRLFGNTIEFLPAEQAPGTYRLTYVPLLNTLSKDSDQFDGFNGFEAYAVCDSAIKCKDKEESSTTVLERERERLLERIEAMANTRDYASVDRVQDVRFEVNSRESL